MYESHRLVSRWRIVFPSYNLLPVYLTVSLWFYVFGVGLLVYFFYGYSHSLEAVRPSEKSETQFILSNTPDFGQEVEEYPSTSE